MRTTRLLAIIAILGIAFSFRASANVVYDSETTNTWFSVNMSTLKAEDLKTSPWKSPKDGEATVASAVIKLDTDLDDPLTYTAAQASEAVAIVAAEMTATVNASVPNLGSVPQAALCVIGTASATNWVGLVGDGNGGTNWVTFLTPVPVAGETYSVRIEFDQRPNLSRQIRYRVGNTVLGDGWYPNPQKTAAANIQSVSFSGTGDIKGLGGSNVVANAATFNGVGYTTFANALAAAKAAGTSWNAANPIVLYENATWTAETRLAYFNENGHTLTITDGVFTKSDNTYDVTTYADCEAREDATYYKTLETALASGAGKTVTINKDLDGNRTIQIIGNLTLDINSKAINCVQLTVAANATLTLSGNLAVATADILGSVAGDTLTVNGTLTGVNVEKLTFGNMATFAYGNAPIASMTTLTLGNSLWIIGLDDADVGTVVINNAAVADATLSMFNATVKEGTELAIDGNQLKIVKAKPDIEIEIDDDTAGYDFTNGTVNVKTTVKPGASGQLKLTVYDFNGNIREEVAQNVNESTTKVSWDLDDLTAGGTYSYEIVINDGSKNIGTAHGEFTAANWGDVWFGADASKGDGQREVGGSWATEPSIENKVYVIEEDSVFIVDEAKQGQGSNRVTRVDAAVTFESLVDGDVDVPADEAISGFVATTDGWKALAKGEWVSLTGGPTPVAGMPYVVRAEVDFISNPKRVRYLVSEDDGKTFIPLSSGTALWIDLATSTKSLLAQVELQGSGKVAKFEATVADKAIAVVEGKEYDTMAEALEAAGTNGTEQIELLTNATIEPTEKGKYDIAAGGHKYVSGGEVSSGDRTIIVNEPGQPPLVRPSEEVMVEVTAPGLKNGFKDTDSLRKFLEKNGVEAYTAKKDATAKDISDALAATPQDANGLALWQDYAMGIDKTDSVAPVTKPAGDTDPDNITLAIPAVDPAKYSKDYDITYKVENGAAESNPQSIKVPLTTGTYSIKAIFTPKN